MIWIKTIERIYNRAMEQSRAQTPEANAEPRFALNVREYVLLAVGYGCMVGFVRICSLGFVGYLTYEVSSSLDQWYVLRTVSTLATLALLAFVGAKGRFKLGLKSMIAATVCAIASAIVFAVDASGATRPFIAGVDGVASAVFMYTWMCLLCNYEPRVLVAVTLPGLLIAGVIVEGVPIVGPDVGLVLAVATAFAAGACVILVDHDLSSCASDGPFDKSARMRVPWLTVIMIVACGFLVSVLYGVAEYMTWLYDWQPNYVVFVIGILAAIVATAAIVLQSRNWMRIAWVPLFALFALAIIFSCLPMRSTVQVAAGLMMAAVFSSHFLHWLVFPALFNKLEIPRACAVGVVLICVNSSLASLVGDALGAALPRSMQNLGSVAGIMAIAVAVLFAVAVVVNRNRVGSFEESATAAPAPGEGGAPDNAERIEADAVDVNPLDALKARLDELGEQFGLTPREFEVAMYTVQGYSCAYIAEKLVVSNSTVRFHQQNIYRKFDVHSRNELIDLVSAE